MGYLTSGGKEFAGGESKSESLDVKTMTEKAVSLPCSECDFSRFDKWLDGRAVVCEHSHFEYD